MTPSPSSGWSTCPPAESAPPPSTFSVPEPTATAPPWSRPLVKLPDELSPRARISLERFFRILDEAREQRTELDPGDLVGWLLEASGLLAMYDGDNEEKTARRENLQQLAAAVAEAAGRGQDLEAFLDAISLLEDQDEESTPDAISLMTLHAAKGLEFDVVILAGFEDGLLPHSNSRDEPESLEEERRLAYVGMTRSRRWLAMTVAADSIPLRNTAPDPPIKISRGAARGLLQRCLGLSPDRIAVELRSRRSGDRGSISTSRPGGPLDEEGRGDGGRRIGSGVAARRPGPARQVRNRGGPRLPGHRTPPQAGGLLRPSREKNPRPDNRQTRSALTCHRTIAFSTQRRRAIAKIGSH